MNQDQFLGFPIPVALALGLALAVSLAVAAVLASLRRPAPLRAPELACAQEQQREPVSDRARAG